MRQLHTLITVLLLAIAGIRSVAFPTLAEKHVLSSLAEVIRDPLKVHADGIKSATGAKLDHADAYYTLNRIPK